MKEPEAVTLIEKANAWLKASISIRLLTIGLLILLLLIPVSIPQRLPESKGFLHLLNQLRKVNVSSYYYSKSPPHQQEFMTVQNIKFKKAFTYGVNYACRLRSTSERISTPSLACSTVRFIAGSRRITLP